MKIAMYQMYNEGNMQDNLKKSLSAIEEAANHQADLILFPEVFLTEFFPQYKDKTHDLDMAYDLVDEVILIHKGMLITKGDKQILTNKDILESNGLELPLRFQ